MSYFWTSAHLWGDHVYVRGYLNGTLIEDKEELKPYLFYEGAGPYKTLQGVDCWKKEYTGWRAARDELAVYNDVENKPVFGMSQFLYTHLNDKFPGEVDYDPAMIARCSIDIETMSDGSFPKVDEADKAITAITLTHRRGKERKIAMFGYGAYKAPEGVRYYMCKDEVHMMETFLDVWNEPDWTPDVLTGWFIEGFDVPYIINRIRRILGDGAVKLLSPWRIVRDREITRGQSVGQKNSTQTVYEIFGVSILDYMELYKKFSFKNQESWGLDNIAFVELGKRKKDYSQFSSLHEFYLKDYQGYMDYNLEDTLLVDEIDDKCGFIDLVLAFAYDAKVTFNDTMTTTRPWDVIIHNYLLKQNIVVPQSLGSVSGGSIVGGYVKDVTPGLFRGVASFDFDSLYPHLIMGWNISPETYAGRVDFDAIASLRRGTLEADVAALKDQLGDKYILAGNGCIFRKDIRGFLPVLMETMYNDRVKYKDLMKEAKKKFVETKDPKYEKLIARYHNLQLAKKIQLNSAFGALANEYFRWFANYLAEAITMSGQMSTMWTEQGVNAFMNKVLKSTNSDYVIAADTDSIYLNLEPLMASVDILGKPVNEMIDFMEAACVGKIQKVIDARCQALTDLVGCPTNKLKMKREALANKGIWTAKKKYLLNVWDLEGLRYKEAQLKVTGIETVRSSTPRICRDNLKKALKIIIDGTEEQLQDFIVSYKEEFKTKAFHEIASPRGIKGMHEYRDAARIYKKGTPIQVRGALLFNKQVKDMKLENKYQPITDGSKIKFCYLKIPNPIRENVIAVPEILPPEFGLESFIDYDVQYEKAFIAPIEKITAAIGWNTEKSGSLFDFL
jgi:DNA polymerase elongation subunit (family B)